MSREKLRRALCGRKIIFVNVNDDGNDFMTLTLDDGSKIVFTHGADPGQPVWTKIVKRNLDEHDDYVCTDELWSTSGGSGRVGML
ncbi:MAG: hypothetical protein Q8O87_01405 [bacterium]|nr:hypothetical protein [bacterium]